ncbi:MAG: PIN domain-containing protein [Nanoarchaeota archaeon]|jgi:rRNA-processing protein FCF1|nr:PIN domain-containing protein [Nanoarchaeota archaeon]
MAKVVLDTNFILYCVANKVDFQEELLMQGHRVLIPKEVIAEIKRLHHGSKAMKFREHAELALKFIASQDYDEIDAPGRYVDKGLVKYCEEHPQVVLATMDKELKKRVKNHKMVLRGGKKLELQ